METKLCNKHLYTSFLQVTQGRFSALSLSEISPNSLSHDSISRWLGEAKCRPIDIWNTSKENILKSVGVIIADDTVIEKSYSQRIEIVRYQYSGTEHKVVKGIGMLNMMFLDQNNNLYPMDLRIWEPKEDGKTKNDHFREMLVNAKKRGVKPEVILADSWYSSLKNLKCIRDLGWYFVMGFKKNRIVNRNQKLETLEIPDQGIRLHLRGYGWMTVFRLVEKNGYTRYIGTNIDSLSKEEMIEFVEKRWQIEVFHRELKQSCGLENCQARASRSQRNHIVLSVISWIKQQKLQILYHCSIYKLKWHFIKNSIKQNLKILLSINF